MCSSSNSVLPPLPSPHSTPVQHTHTISPLGLQPVFRSDAVSYKFLPLSRMFLPSSLPASLDVFAIQVRASKPFTSLFYPSTPPSWGRIDCLSFQIACCKYVTILLKVELLSPIFASWALILVLGTQQKTMNLW